MNSLKNKIKDSIEIKSILLEDEQSIKNIRHAANKCIQSFNNNGKVFFCGNGGSAADAQHLAAELSGKYYFDREPLYAEAFHVNTSYLTAVANDYQYSEVYSRIVKAKCKKGDVLFSISTSGNSENVVRAAEMASKKGVVVIGMTGQKGGKLASICDILLTVPSSDTARIQEVHILIGHLICEIVEKGLFTNG